MRVILQENIANLGKIGDQIKVKAGYARNYLLPKGKAAVATEANIKAVEAHRVELEKKAAELLELAQQRGNDLTSKDYTIAANAGEEGKLFGSIGPRDIAVAIEAQGLSIAKSEVLMPEGPIRQIGEYPIDIKLHADLIVQVKVNIVAE